MENIVNYFVAVYFGVIIGNFATSFYFRIPRNIPLIGLKIFNSFPPSCSVCNHPLKLKEYIPIFGYIFCKGRCNYCGEKVNIRYLIIEVFALTLSIICYYFFYFLDWYIIFLFFGVASLIMSLTLYEGLKVNLNFIYFSIFLSIIYSVLVKLTVYDSILKVACFSILYSLYLQLGNYKNFLNLELIKIITIAFFGLILAL